MPNNKTKKKFKNKKRSCVLCKPQKRHIEDARTMQDRRADDKVSNYLQDLEGL